MQERGYWAGEQTQGDDTTPLNQETIANRGILRQALISSVNLIDCG
jgi:hypothetical protein